MLIKRIKSICLISVFFSSLVLAQVQKERLPLENRTNNTPMVVVADDTEEPPRKVSLIAFNADVYDVAYQTFLANQNLHNAYIIAKAAVQQDPDNLFWRKRFAQISRWTNQPQQSLTQWLYIVEKKPDEESIHESIGLAQDLYDYVRLAKLYKLQLKYQGKHKESLKGYVGAKEAEGEHREASTELKELILKDEKPSYYEELAKLYKNTGEDQAALDTINKMQVKYKVPVDLALIKAEILYARSNIKASYDALLPYVQKAPRNNIEYWKVLGQLAWLSQDYAKARKAYTVLYEQKYEDQIVYIRLIALLPQIDPKKAYNLSVEAWKKYQQNYFLLNVMNLATVTRQWQKFNQFINTLPDSVIIYLETLAYYYSTKAQMYSAFDQKNKAIALYQLGLQRFPNSTVLQKDYLWFLIQNKNKDILTQKLNEWSTQIAQDESFLPVLSAAYVELNQPERLLHLYRNKKLSDTTASELMALSNALGDLNQHTAADRLQDLAWRNLVELSESTDEEAILNTERGLIEFSSIGGNYLSGEDLTLVQEKLTELAQSGDQAYQALMSWALRHQQYEWVRYLWSRRNANQKVPIWMQQSIALHRNDLYHLDKLLKENLEDIPYRDRVLIAQKLGYKRMAQQLAYRGLKEHPADRQIHDIFSTIELQDSPYIIVDPYYRDNGAVAGRGFQWRARIVITPRMSIIPFGDIWHIQSSDTATILTPTSIDRMIGLEIRERIRRGEMKYIIGERHGLKDFVFGSLVVDYQLFKKLNILGELAYNKKASDSTALLIAGMKNEARITLQWLLTRYDTLISVLGYQYFKSQDNVHLGSGQSLDVVYNRKLFQAYPDWNMAIFGTIQRYQLNGSLSDAAASIIPENQTRDVSFYIPDSFIRYGASIGFGQTYKAGYTQFWRPFGQLSVYNTTTGGVGHLVEAGVAGSVFGLDHLAFFATRGTNLEAAGQTDDFIGLRYQLYF